MSSSSRSYSDADIKLLWGQSAARCNYPDCRQECVAPGTGHDRATARIGRNAHIVASSDNGPRGDPDFATTDRDKYENLILLCANHHDLVDGQPNTYTVDMLRQWKSDHERWVRETLQVRMAAVTFKELDEVCSHIMSDPAPPETDLRLTDPSTKMHKNGLTGAIRGLVDMGLARTDVVQAFIQQRVDLDFDFPERLKAGFLAEYYKLYSSGERGDTLFHGLRTFAAGGGNDFTRDAAGLAVLCYLFQTCEVFDK
jgi:hypothetical protein